MTTELGRSKKWQRTNGQNPCPLCHKSKGCLIAHDGVICLRVPSAKEVHKGLGGYYHPLHSDHALPSTPVVLIPGSQRKAEPVTLDRVYQHLLDQHQLSPEDLLHLTQVRQLHRDAIAHRKYRSWGQFGSMRSKIARLALEYFGSVALDVPGIIVRKQMGERPEYVTLAGASGIAIPIRDVADKISGIQLRIQNPKPGCGKYVWLSSASQGGATAGTPVHVARPLQATSSQRMWLTEGPLKADIACERLQEVVLAVPGVKAIADFVPTLDALMERQELRELVIALDSDWRENKDVRKARFLMAERAARVGVIVWLADWDQQYKGLDDLLLAGHRPTLIPYKVQGNGPRQIISQPAKENKKVPLSCAPAMPLDSARKEQKKQLQELLGSKKEPGTSRGILMKAKPGVGKSSTLTGVLNCYTKRRSRKSILVFVPRYEIGLAPGRTDWDFVRGRTHSTAKLSSPCSHPNLQGQLASLRVPGQLGCEMCPALELCRKNSSRSEGPFYHAQFQKKARISVHPVQHFLLPSLIRSASVVVLDDCDLRSLAIEEIRISRLQIEAALSWARSHPNHAYAKAKDLLEVLLALMNRDDALDKFCWQELDLFQRLEQAAVFKVGRPLDSILQEAQESQEPEPLTENFQVQAELPVRFIREFAEVLQWEYQQYLQSQKSEWPGWNCRIRLRRKFDIEWTLKQRRDFPRTALVGKDLVIVDASLTLSEAQQLFPDHQWDVIDPPVEMPNSVRILQFPEQSWGKSRLSSNNPKARHQALQLIGEIVERHEGQSIAVLTHKCFADDVKKKFPHVKVGHFYGQRGSNQFEQCDVEIVFGTPCPNPDELQEQGEALYWDQKRVLRQTILEPQCLGKSQGQEQWVSVRTHADPRLRELHRSKSLEELIQAIYRIRPLSVEEGRLFPSQDGQRTQATVYVFSSLPLPQLNVELIRKTPAKPAVLDLSQAAQKIHERRQLVTEERLATEANVNRWQVRQFLPTLVRSRLGQGPPPSQAPPAA